MRAFPAPLRRSAPSVRKVGIRIAARRHLRLLPAFLALAALALGWTAAAIALAAVLPLWLVLRDGARDGRGRAGTLDVVGADMVGVVEGMMARARDMDRMTALLLVRVDPGHRPPAEAVALAAVRARGVLREGDRILRRGTDGFAVVLDPIVGDAPGPVRRIADRLVSALGEPVDDGPWPTMIAAHVGTCTCTATDGLRPAQVVASAEDALAAAVVAGPGSVVLRHGRDRGGIADALAADLGAALDAGQVAAWFQPIVSLADGSVVGVEALARWRHPTHGLVPPPRLLDAAARGGLAPRMAEAMLAQSIEALRDLDRAGVSVPMISVNLSQHELRDPDLAGATLDRLRRAGLPPDRLVIEILETVVAGPDEDVAMRNLSRLARAGVRLDLDDFGIAAGCIANVTRFGVHRLKIDRSLVTGLAGHADRRRTVSAVLRMAEAFGVGVIAEGVETPADADALRALGCTVAQGYAICRPVPADDLRDWLRGRARHAAPRRGRAGRPAEGSSSPSALPREPMPPERAANCADGATTSGFTARAVRAGPAPAEEDAGFGPDLLRRGRGDADAAPVEMPYRRAAPDAHAGQGGRPRAAVMD